MATREEEDRYFAAFRRARPDIRFDYVDHQDRPDFLCSLGARQVGIEVTRFSPAVPNGSPRPEAQDSLQDWTMVLARRAYQSAAGLPLHVHATFSSYRPLSKKRAPALARELADLLLDRVGSLGIYEQAEFDHILADRTLPEIAGLSVLRVPTEAHGVWYGGQGAWVRHATETEITRTVAAKEPRVSSYRRRCDEVWLLIVFELLAGNTYVAPPISPDFVIRSGFGRVFCIAAAGNSCVEVLTVAVAA